MSDPQEIDSFDQLVKVLRENEEAEVVLTDDLCVSQDYCKIGAFDGVLDGQGHKIYGFPDHEIESVGLYASFIGHNSGIIKNLKIPDLNIVVEREHVEDLGFVGHNTGRIENCKLNGAIVHKNKSSDMKSCGSLASQNSGIVKECKSSVSLYVEADYVGGLVGMNLNHVNDCHYINGELCAPEVGGLVGQNGHEIKDSSVSCHIHNCDSAAGIAHTNSGKILRTYIREITLDSDISHENLSIFSVESDNNIRFCSWIEDKIPDTELVTDNKGSMGFIQSKEDIEAIKKFMTIGKI